MRRVSSSVRPRARASARGAACPRPSRWHARDVAASAREQPQAVGRPGQRVDRVLGVRHQAEHVARLVRDAGDVARGAVRVLARRVAQHELAVAPRARRAGPRARTSARCVCLTGSDSTSPGVARARERACRSCSTTHVDLAADEAQRGVGQQRAGQQAAPRTAPGSRCRCRAPGRPRAANRATSSITGAKRAIAPARR